MGSDRTHFSHDLTSAQPTGRKRWRWLSGGLLLVLFSPLLVVILWYAGVRIANARAITRLEMEIRQRGEPVTLAELQASYPPIPDEQNAALALLALWEKEDPAFWMAFRKGTRPLPEHQAREVDPDVPILGGKGGSVARGKSLDPAALAAAKEYLAREANHFAAAHEALAHPQGRFPLNFGEGYALLLPHLATIKREAQNFRLAALIAAEKGKVDEAITALRDAARAGQILAEDPLLISQLVRIACLAIAIGGTEDLLSRQKLKAPQLEHLRSVLEEIKTSDGIKQSLLGERAFALSVFERGPQAAAALSGSDSPARSQSLAVGAMKFIGLAAMDKRLMLETFKPAIAAAEQGTPEAMKEIERTFQSAGVKARHFPPRIFSAMTLPGLERVTAKFSAQEARRRAALVAVAIERYRLQHDGRPPERLDALIPQFLAEVPTDPFDGQPLRYQNRENGYVVYSIGADGADDGGSERKPGSGGSRNIDDTFVVEH
jgi:type II secretory pathway pseudopilin PulG